MGQVKIYGLKDAWHPIKDQLSETIHSCVVDGLQFPREKRFHRFILLHPDDFYYPADRTDRYLIIEISVFEGRSVQAKKELIRLLFTRLRQTFGMQAQDIEITIFETPACNWGIRGVPGDELKLNYTVEV